MTSLAYFFLVFDISQRGMSQCHYMVAYRCVRVCAQCLNAGAQSVFSLGVRLCAHTVRKRRVSCRGYISTGTCSVHLQTVEIEKYRQNSGTGQRQTDGRKVKLHPASDSNGPHWKCSFWFSLSLTVWILFFLRFVQSWAAVTVPATFVTSNSTYDCTECLVKLQNVEWIIPPEQYYGKSWVGCEHRRSEAFFSLSFFFFLILKTSTHFQAFNQTGIDR